jgi:hypothetical protein
MAKCPAVAMAVDDWFRRVLVMMRRVICCCLRRDGNRVKYSHKVGHAKSRANYLSKLNHHGFEARSQG